MPAIVCPVNGDEIRARREARGLTQQQLATAVGVGMRTVGNWERGESVPKNRLGMLRQFFGLDDTAGEDDPLRAASEISLLAELLRRAEQRRTAASA